MVEVWFSSLLEKNTELSKVTKLVVMVIAAKNQESNQSRNDKQVERVFPRNMQYPRAANSTTRKSCLKQLHYTYLLLNHWNGRKMRC